jgi:uncharacterized membrane protein
VTQRGTASGPRAGRLRGLDNTRLDTFVDAAFAFAMTLIVISIDEIPRNYDQLMAALKSTPAFAASFAQLVMFWLGHRQWSRRYGLESPLAITLTLILVFTVMVFVYPLRVVYGEFFDFFSGGRLTSGFDLQGFDNFAGLFVVYGIAFTAMAGTLALLYVVTLRTAPGLGLSERERHEARSELGAYLILTVTALVSIIAALALPTFWTPIAAWAYATLPITMPAWALWRSRDEQRRFGPGR